MNQIQDREDAARWPYVLAMMLLLAPFSPAVGDANVAANYLFAVLLVSPSGYRWNTEAATYVLLMTLSLIVGVFLFSEFDPLFLSRQSISFLLALLGVLLLFVRLDLRREELVRAAVLCSVIYAAYALLSFATKGFSLTDIYFVKGGMRDFVPDWPQRYVVVLLFAFFVALSRYSRGFLWQFASALILICIFLTFTRAAWLGLAAGLPVYVLARRTGMGARVPLSTWSRIVGLAGLTGLVTLIAVALTNELVADAVKAIWDSFTLLFQGADQFNVGGSEDERVDLYTSIFERLMQNPLTGTGFAGAYLVIEGQGSAHGQMQDVLLRTGLIGLGFYLWFYARLFAYYRRVDPGIVAGLAALFVFGFFHETIKLTYAAVIFYLLLNKVFAAEAAVGKIRGSQASDGRPPSLKLAG